LRLIKCYSLFFLFFILFAGCSDEIEPNPKLPVREDLTDTQIEYTKPITMDEKSKYITRIPDMSDIAVETDNGFRIYHKGKWFALSSSSVDENSQIFSVNGSVVAFSYWKTRLFITKLNQLQWKKVEVPGKIVRMIPSRVRPDTVFATIYTNSDDISSLTGDLYISQDMGKTWNQLIIPDYEHLEFGLLNYSDRDKYVYVIPARVWDDIYVFRLDVPGKDFEMAYCEEENIDIGSFFRPKHELPAGATLRDIEEKFHSK